MMEGGRGSTIPLMEKRGQATDRHGRTWTARIVSQDEAEEEDFRFWYEELTPEERVRAVEDCTLSARRAPIKTGPTGRESPAQG